MNNMGFIIRLIHNPIDVGSTGMALYLNPLLSGPDVIRHDMQEANGNIHIFIFTFRIVFISN